MWGQFEVAQLSGVGQHLLMVSRNQMFIPLQRIAYRQLLLLAVMPLSLFDVGGDKSDDKMDSGS